MKKFLMGLLTLTMAFVCFGCGEEETDSPKTETPAAEEKSGVLLGFESVRELLSLYRLNVLKTSLNEDTTYITEGKASMKIEYAQEVGENEYAKDMTIGCTTDTQYFDKKTSTDIKYFAVDIYSPGEKEYELGVNVGGALFNTYTLKQGWNTIETYVDRSVLGYVRNDTLGFYSLVFRGQKGDSATFYVDNFRYERTEEEFEKYAFDSSKEVWNTFEKEGEIATLQKYHIIESLFSNPRFEINRNKEYILTGTGSLKVSFPKKKSGEMDTTAFATKDGLFPDLNKYLQNAEDNYYIYFDIFNGYDKDITAKVTLLTADSAGREKYTVEVKIPAKSWSDKNASRLYLKDMDAAFAGSGIAGQSLIYEFSGITKDVTDSGAIYLDSIGVRK